MTGKEPEGGVPMSAPLARDLMTHPVLTIRDDRTLGELTAFFSENAISGAPVVDEKGALVGVVTVTDLSEQAMGDESPALADRSRSVFFHEGWECRMNPEELRALSIRDAGQLVRDIMTPVVYAIPGSTPVERVARTMIAGRIHRLLVTEKGRVSGIVTTLDLLKLLAGKPRARPRSSRRFPEVSTSHGRRGRKARG
jgi:CBS domain-containing protein